jgi:hypothetical protein
VKVYAEPAFTDASGLPLIVSSPLPETAETVIVKAGKEAVSVPSLTLIRMFG